MKHRQLTLIKGRTLTIGERVEVYYNLHQGGFSIKSLDKTNKDKGRVVAYTPFFTIVQATFHVSQKGLSRIQEKKCKEVYAVVRGYYLDACKKEIQAYKDGYLNPYVTGSFVDRMTQKELVSAKEVYFTDKYFYFIE